MEELTQYDWEDYMEEDSSFNIYNNAVIWGMDWTTETIASQMEKDNIDINPKFQRRDAWTQGDKSRLIESLILNMPVPPIILAERKDERNKFIVIDGKQRLLSIKQFCTKKEGFEKLQLKGMEILKELNGKTMDTMLQDAGYERYVTSFENATLRTIVIKGWTDEQYLYSVFLRLNTGSKPLSPQELRQALHPGPFLDFLDDATAECKELMEVLRNDKADTRMRDIELALRYYGYQYNRKNNNGNLKLFLDDTCKLLNDNWEKMEEEIRVQFKELRHAIAFCLELFGEKAAFSKYHRGKFNNRFNRALFEVFTFYFSNPYIREKLKKDKFLSLFKELSQNDVEFQDSISNTTKDLRKVEKRFKEIEKILMLCLPELPVHF